MIGCRNVLFASPISSHALPRLQYFFFLSRKHTIPPCVDYLRRTVVCHNPDQPATVIYCAIAIAFNSAAAKGPEWDLPLHPLSHSELN